MNAQWLDKSWYISLWADIFGSLFFMYFPKHWAVQGPCGIKPRGISNLFTKLAGWGTVVRTPKLSQKPIRTQTGTSAQDFPPPIVENILISGKPKLVQRSYAGSAQLWVSFTGRDNFHLWRKLFVTIQALFCATLWKSVEIFSQETVLWKAIKVHWRGRLTLPYFQKALKQNKAKQTNRWKNSTGLNLHYFKVKLKTLTCTSPFPYVLLSYNN